jgi:UDP-N-acetyl-2-amino-2-deoxyglucuronate dehydrogenase
MKRFRVGIIGCGSIFPMHSVSVVQQANAELVAVCDIKEDRAKQRAEEYNCAYYLDYQEMIDKENLDVVHICTPHYLHAPMAVYAAEKGVHILTEKPMAIELADAYAMIEAAENSGVVLGVIFQNRYNPGSKLIKEVLDSGELGRVLSCKLSVTWKRTDEYYSLSDWKGTWELEGGGVVIDQAIHTLDLARWFINSEIEYVEASIANRTHSKIEVEDVAEGVIKFKNGVLTSFYTINYHGYDAPVEIELYCEHGLAKMTADSGVVRLNNGRELRADPDPNEFFNYGAVKQYWGVSHIKQITNFYQALAQGVEPDITGRDAVKTQELVCAIYQSGKQRTRVVL